MNTNLLRSFVPMLFFAPIVLAILACDIGQAANPVPARAPLSPAPTAPAPKTALPTRASQSAPPAWWDAKVEMPKTAEFSGDAKRAVWSTRDTNAEGIKDFLTRQANAASYQVFAITQSKGAIYDLLLVKGQTAYALNVTLGSDATIITASRVGVMHLQVSGAANVEVDLPFRTRVDTTPGSEVSIGTSLPNPQCAQCEYFINVHIAPFRGVGDYDSKPGISIIDVELVPGGDHDKDNYRWAQNCVVSVKENSGTFDCRGLQNINDQSKKVDASGAWQQPP